MQFVDLTPVGHRVDGDLPVLPVCPVYHPVIAHPQPIHPFSLCSQRLVAHLFDVFKQPLNLVQDALLDAPVQPPQVFCDIRVERRFIHHLHQVG